MSAEPKAAPIPVIQAYLTYRTFVASGRQRRTPRVIANRMFHELVVAGTTTMSVRTVARTPGAPCAVWRLAGADLECRHSIDAGVCGKLTGAVDSVPDFVRSVLLISAEVLHQYYSVRAVRRGH